ncbi:glutathione ABC transporter substrate-binding protein [Metaplanococcus flavidus]|uniref:Glutathione ABC transporter substrate-binding protein n=1 Tax=Metaplanococcus flavidus TaxID=569883 RepID=A0ABW3L8L1_9BACL
MIDLKKFGWPLILVLVMGIFLAACAGGSDESESSEEPGAENGNEETAGGDLVLAVLADASTLDPQGTSDVTSSVVQENIYENLVEKDENNDIIPGLAKSWKAVDELTWSFTLNEGIKFHDGEDFNAEAVKANLDRILNPDLGSPRHNLFAMITDVEVVSEYELHISTEYAFSPLLSHLTHNSVGMISPALIEQANADFENGDDPFAAVSANPAGTGYFKFDSWEPGQMIRLVKNEDYWGEPAHVDSVEFRVVPDSQVRLANLETGNVHIIDPVQPNEVSRIENGDAASIHRQASASLLYLGFHTEKEPFDNPLVRQAISHAIDHESIVSGIYEDLAIPATGPLAPGTFGYSEDVEGITYNMDKARELMAEAGYEDGFSTTIWTSDNPQRLSIAVLVQEALADLNIDVEIQSMEFGTYLDATAAGEHDMLIDSYSNPTGDADYQMYTLFHSSQKGESGNLTFYENAEVDALLDDARRETEPEERAAIYAEAANILTEEAPMSFLLHQEFLLGVADNISGFEINSAGIYNLKNVQIGQ